MSDTPHTDQFLQTMFRDLGSLGPHNCPEWLVEYARNQEQELNRIREDLDFEKRLRRDQQDRAEAWRECAVRLMNNLTELDELYGEFFANNEVAKPDWMAGSIAQFDALKAREG